MLINVGRSLLAPTFTLILLVSYRPLSKFGRRRYHISHPNFLRFRISENRSLIHEGISDFLFLIKNVLTMHACMHLLTTYVLDKVYEQFGLQG